tara:strand:+ start:1777 stop:2046 length:270 start_codon:yes stop_codon:yes gene_type:complete
LLANATKDSITGTSTKTPTTVAKAAPEFSPNKLIETATANSKKLEVPIIAHGAATLNGTFNRHAEKYAMANTPYDWIKSGIAINRIKTG